MTLYAATIFLSAFLLFQVQPLIAKIILPWFGGSAAVWSAAMLFFQVSLLAGYAYAHFLIGRLEAKTQMQVHGALLAGQPGAAADPAIRTGSRSAAGDPTAAHSAAARRHHRAALFSALLHQPAAASLVRAPHRLAVAVPPVRAFEFRIHAGAGQLSVPGRAEADLAPAGL